MNKRVIEWMSEYKCVNEYMCECVSVLRRVGVESPLNLNETFGRSGQV